MTRSFRRFQLKTLGLCWLVYAMAYFGRLNLSVALPGLQQLTGAGKAQLGLIGTLFFWLYGIGQLLGGHLGDRLKVRYLVFWGLLCSAGCNLLFAFTRTLFPMSVLWALNGISQSMVWAPLVKTVVRWVEPNRRHTAMIGISTSMVGGFLLAWGVLGQWVQNGQDVLLLFLVPGITLAIISFLWLWQMRDDPKEAGFSPLFAKQIEVQRVLPRERIQVSPAWETTMPIDTPANREGTSQPAVNPAGFWEIATRSRLWLIVLACFAQGIVRDGITLWAPTFFIESHGLTLQQATATILFLPAMNLGGMLLAGWLTSRLGQRAEKATAFQFLAAMLFLVGLQVYGGKGPFVAVLLMGLASGMMYGVNTLLLGVIPLQFEAFGRVSLFSGVLNFLAYMASGLASIFTGFLVDLTGWNGVFLSWVILAAAGSAALLLREKQHRQEIQPASQHVGCPTKSIS